MKRAGEEVDPRVSVEKDQDRHEPFVTQAQEASPSGVASGVLQVDPDTGMELQAVEAVGSLRIHLALAHHQDQHKNLQLIKY